MAPHDLPLIVAYDCFKGFYSGITGTGLTREWVLSYSLQEWKRQAMQS